MTAQGHAAYRPIADQFSLISYLVSYSGKTAELWRGVGSRRLLADYVVPAVVNLDLAGSVPEKPVNGGGRG